MRARFRVAILVLAVALAACQRQAGPADGPAAGDASGNVEREAEVAREQLAALGARANAAQRAQYEGEFQASGSLDALGSAEGAWELTLLEDYAQFLRPGLGEDGALAGPREYRARGMQVVAGPLTITIKNEACTASGVELPYVAHVLFEGVAYQGCARRGVAEGARPTWASVLPDLMPAIDACLQRVNARPARVTFASALEDGETSVRIRENDGTRRVCTVGSEGVRYEPISDIDTAPGEGDPEFQRGPEPPARAQCSEQALDRAGAAIGWLIRRRC
jgi:uncharacterized membrane protein